MVRMIYPWPANWSKYLRLKLIFETSYERTEADYIEKLKKDYQSVLGVGKTQPNPEESKVYILYFLKSISLIMFLESS